MHFNICSGLLALSATHVLAKSRHSVGGCPEPHDEIRSIAKSFNENKADAKEPGTIQVKTFVHIVTNEADSSDYDQAIVDLQVCLLFLTDNDISDLVALDGRHEQCLQSIWH